MNLAPLLTIRFVSILLALFSCVDKLVNAGQHQKSLLKKLFENYNPFERPAEFENNTLDVKLGMALQQIVDVDEKKQTIVFSGWLDMTWNDYNLKWDPKDYGNITSIRVTSNQIWIPDLILYNSADDSFDTTAKVNAVLYHDGTVTYLPPGVFKSTCQIKIEDFPFDEQSCEVKFGSWTYDEDSVNLTNKSDQAQLDSYIINGEWHLINVTSYSESKKYECCPEKYPFVLFVINIQRRTLYFLFNLIFPCVLISFMSVLGFTLPPDSGEKIGLEITTLLSIIMFLQLITSIIPESSLSIPKIGIYFGSVMVICSMSIIANVIVLIFHHRNVKIQQPMAKWIDVWICGYLARLLNMRIPDKKESSTPTKKSSSSSSASSSKTKKNELFTRNSSFNELNELSSKSLLANVLDINDDFGVISANKYLKSPVNSSSESAAAKHNSLPQHQLLAPPPHIGFKREIIMNGYSHHSVDEANETSSSRMIEVNAMKKSLNSILKELRVITNKLRDDEEEEDQSLNWKFAAMVIDRLCVVFFSMATFFSFVLILLTSKNFFKLS